ncbi:RsmD family RNA methyltransferase [Chloroflexota bacterium]
MAKGTHTRPATYLARGVAFSILESTIADRSRALDLYAGTGALGIEALSRGAAWVDFVEQEPRCCAIIRRNLKNTGLESQGHVYCCSVAKALSFLGDEYDIIFVDPPYFDSPINNLLEQLSTSKIRGIDSAIVVFHSRHMSLLSTYGDLCLLKERRHGDTCISLYQGEGNL